MDIQQTLFAVLEELRLLRSDLAEKQFRLQRLEDILEDLIAQPVGTVNVQVIKELATPSVQNIAPIPGKTETLHPELAQVKSNDSPIPSPFVEEPYAQTLKSSNCSQPLFKENGRESNLAQNSGSGKNDQDDLKMIISQEDTWNIKYHASKKKVERRRQAKLRVLDRMMKKCQEQNLGLESLRSIPDMIQLMNLRPGLSWIRRNEARYLIRFQGGILSSVFVQAMIRKYFPGVSEEDIKNHGILAKKHCR